MIIESIGIAGCLTLLVMNILLQRQIDRIWKRQNDYESFRSKQFKEQLDLMAELYNKIAALEAEKESQTEVIH